LIIYIIDTLRGRVSEPPVEVVGTLATVSDLKSGWSCGLTTTINTVNFDRTTTRQRINGSDVLLNTVNSTQGLGAASTGNATIVFPSSSKLGGSSGTGVIQFKLPNIGNVWVHGTIKIYDYTGKQAVVDFGGLMALSQVWDNKARATLVSSTIPSLKIRFGTDGANAYIWLGETTDTWSFLSASIEEITLYNSVTTPSVAALQSGFATTISGSVSTVNHTITIGLDAPAVPLSPSINFGGVTTSNVQTALAAIDARLDTAMAIPTLNADAWSANASIANSSRTDTLTNVLAYGFFQRVGSIVNFTVKFEVALNSDTTSNVVSVSPPYASDFTDEKVDVGGTATINAGGIYGGAALKVERCILYADPTTNKISISYTVDKQGGTYPSNRVIVSASGSYIVQ